MLAPKKRFRLVRHVLLAGAVCLCGPDLAGGSAPHGHSEQGQGLPKVERPFQAVRFFSGLGSNQMAVCPGTQGFDTQLYVVLHEAEMIAQINRFGEVTPFADLRAFRSLGEYWSPTFDAQGKYGGALFLNEFPNHVDGVDPSGNVYGFTTNAGPKDILSPQNVTLACDPYGSFQGRLFLTDAPGRLLEVDTNGDLFLLATGLGEAGHSMVFSPGGAFGDYLYIADAGSRRILRISPDHVPGSPGELWLDLSSDALAIEPVDLVISAQGPFGTDIMYVSDAASSRVIKFAPDGSFLGEFATGLGGAATIELPRSGDFHDKMVIATKQEIWLVHRAATDFVTQDQTTVPGDLDQDGDVDPADVELLLGDFGCADLDCPGDLDGNGGTDLPDLQIMLTNLGAQP